MKRSWLSVHMVLGVLFLLNIIFYIAALVKQPLTVIADRNALFRNAVFRKYSFPLRYSPGFGSVWTDSCLMIC